MSLKASEQIYPEPGQQTARIGYITEDE